MIELCCRRVVFGSPGDEAAFFSWVGSIEGVQRVFGVGDTIRLEMPPVLPDEALRELLAVFRRYDIDMAQLARFASASNAAWFTAPGTYWHDRVFRQAGDDAPGTALDRGGT